tara:strand:- start:3250 stop:3597 length:348 start_codon:yes stop_codon:yes gene_type:complete
MVKKTCAWCHKPTKLPETFAAKTPILEWLEKRIEEFCDKNDYSKQEVWGLDSDWGVINIPEQFEAELLVYDSLLISVERKTICKDCLVEDQKLWDKYYHGLDDNNDFEITIDDLK